MDNAPVSTSEHEQTCDVRPPASALWPHGLSLVCAAGSVKRATHSIAEHAQTMVQPLRGRGN